MKSFEVLATYNTSNTLFSGKFEKNSPEAIGNKLYSLACEAIKGIETARFALAVSLRKLEKEITDKAKNEIYQKIGFTSIISLCENRLNIGRTQAYKYLAVGELLEENDGHVYVDVDGAPFNFEAHGQLARLKTHSAIQGAIDSKKLLASESVKTVSGTISEMLNVVEEQPTAKEGTPKARTAKAKTTKTETPTAETVKPETEQPKPTAKANETRVAVQVYCGDGNLHSVYIPLSVYETYFKAAIYTPDEKTIWKKPE